MKTAEPIRRLAFFSVILLAAVLTLNSSNAVGANEILNGSFEAPVAPPDSYLNISAGNEPAGFVWKVDSGDVDLAGTNPFVLFPPYDGNQAVDLNGFVRGSIYQEFGTVPGLTYLLTFAYADNPVEGGDSTADVTVSDVTSGDTLLDDGVSHSTSTNSPPNGDWLVYSGTFKASGASTRLLFASTSASNSASGGILLDDVVVQPIPEPSTFVLAGLGLLGLRLLGLGRFARRRAIHSAP